MAVNETIVTGRKFRKLTDAASKKWQRISFWHKASDCEFNDGKTAEEKLGAIKGITTDLNVTVPGYAADATRVSELNNSLGGLQFLQDAEGNWGYKPSGADTVIPFKGDIKPTEITMLRANNHYGTASIEIDLDAQYMIFASMITTYFVASKYYGIAYINKGTVSIVKPSVEEITFSVNDAILTVTAGRDTGCYISVILLD